MRWGIKSVLMQKLQSMCCWTVKFDFVMGLNLSSFGIHAQLMHHAAACSSKGCGHHSHAVARECRLAASLG